MLRCPRCNHQLLRSRNPHGIYFRCKQCDGRMVAVAVLRRTKEHDHVNRLWLQARERNRLGSRKCCFCNQPMVEVTARDAGEPLVLDVCTTCQFVWFDPSEFERTPEMPVAEGLEPELPRAAREQLAMMKVRQIAREAQAQDHDNSPEHWWQVIPAAFGMPVEHGVAGLASRPWVTWLTAAVVVLVSLIAMTDLEEAAGRFGLIPARLGRYGGLTLLTSFFIHGGWIHLIGNMYFLLIFGDNTEDVLGPAQYGLLLLAATLAGGLLHAATQPGSTTPCVGASGGISGVLVFYLLRFPHAKLGFYFLRYLRYVRIPAPLYLVLWIGLQFLGSALSGGRGVGVAYMAHLGGAAVGLAFFLAGYFARRAAARP